MNISRSTFTEPYSLTRPTSLRPRSTSITCSARSFSSCSISSASSWSVCSSLPRGRVPGNGTIFHLPPVHAHQQFRRRARQLKRSFLFSLVGLLCFWRRPQRPLRRKAQKVHIRAGIHGAQRPIHLERVHARLHIETLRKHHLERVPRRDVLLASPHSRHVVALARSMRNVQLARPFARRHLGQRLRQSLFQPGQSLQRPGIRLVGRIERDVRRHHQPDLLAHMVERQHFIEEHQARVRHAQFILGVFRKALDLPHRIVSKDAHRARSERRKPRQPRRLVSSQRIPQHREHVALEPRRPFAFRDLNLPPARHDPLVRIHADERVAAHLLPALHRLQQKALALLPRRAQKCRYRRFQIGRQRAANRHQRVLPGKRQELLAAGMDKSFGGLHKVQFTGTKGSRHRGTREQVELSPF